MADFTQVKSPIISHQAVSNPNSIEGTAVAVADALSCVIHIRHAYIEAVDPGGIEPSFHVLTSEETSGDEAWDHLLELTCKDPGAAPATEAMTATEPVAETVLACASTTGFAAKDQIYVQDAGTEADSEWHLVDKIVSNTSVDIFMGLTNEKDSSDFLWGSAQKFRVPLECGGIKRVIVHYSNEGASAPDTAIEVTVTVATDLE